MGGEWSSKNYGSRKILVRFYGSRSLFYFSGYVPLAVSIFSVMKCLEVSIFFKGKEVLVKAPICLFVFINFDDFSSLGIEFNNTTFKFPRNEVNPALNCLNSAKRTTTSF